MVYYNKEETRSKPEKILGNSAEKIQEIWKNSEGTDQKMQTDRKEALRYLGLGKHEPDPETERLLDS